MSMDSQDGGGPAWLFSFVDLAFLMLIAMTQLAGDVTEAPDLGEMLVPKIGAEQAPGELAMDASKAWQLRIHPADRDSIEPVPPFTLIASDTQELDPSAERIDKTQLAARLGQLYTAGTDKPLLAPHEDSRSQDLLDAAGLLEEHWPSRRRALVARVMEP